MATFQQLRVMKQNGPFEVHKVAKPQPEQDQILVRVKAAAVNPVDYKKAIAGFDAPMYPSWPTVMGLEGAGVVESVGQGVEDFKPGDEILAMFGIKGQSSASFQEYALLPGNLIAKKPASWSFADAATLPIGFGTAVAAIHHSLEIAVPFLAGSLAREYKPKSLLILGGSSAVGSAAIQIVHKVLPDTTIFTTSSPAHHERLISLGASRAFDRTASDVVKQIMAATPSGAGVEAVFDAVGAATTQHEYLTVLTGEKKIFSQLQTGYPLDASAAPAGVDVRITTMQDLFTLPGGPGVFKALESLLARGEWRLPIKTTVLGHGLEHLEAGVRKSNDGVSGTKQVVTL